MIRHCASLVLCLAALQVYAQVSPGAQYAAMGNTGTALYGISSLSSNQAGIAVLSRTELSLTYEQNFISNEISTKAVLVAVPTRLGVFGILVSNYGLSGTYSDLKSGLSYARQLGPQLRMSATFNYHQLTVVNYGSSRSISVEAGVQYQANDKWVLGVHMANPGNLTYSDEIYGIIPAHLRAGTSYLLSSQVTVSADFEWQNENILDFRSGLEYQPAPWLNLRGGLSAHSFKQYAGFGITFHQLTVDYAMSMHTRLGMSSQIALAYAF